MAIYKISLWSGVGYSLESFEVEADSIDEALESVVYLVEQQKKDYLFFDEVENLESLESAGEVLYIDATMQGAGVHYIDSTNLKIEVIQ